MDNIYSIHIYKTNKFKTASLEVVFTLPFKVETISYLNILKNMLINDNSKLTKLREIYDTNVYGVVNRIGNTLTLEIILDYIDPKYTEDYIDKIYKIFFSMITNPTIDDNTLKQAKSVVLDEIDSINDNIMDVSILESLKRLDLNKPYSYNLSGEETTTQKVSLNSIKRFYKKVLDQAYKDIYVISSSDTKKIENIIKKYALFNSIVDNNYKYFVPSITNRRIVKSYIKIDNIGTNLVMIYKLNRLSDFERNYVMPILNMIWGGSYLESKLFKALRENVQLCYNATTIYQKYDRLIILHVSLSKENYNNALKICKNVFKNLNNIINKEDLEKAVKTMNNSISLTKDNLIKTMNNYIFENKDLIDEIDIRIDNFNKVNLDDIYKLIKKIKLISISKVGE